MSRSTRVQSNGSHITTTIALGNLKYVRRYPGWHHQGKEYDRPVILRFEHGSIDMDAATLIQIIRAGQEALITDPTGFDCSGAYADIEDAG